MGAFSSFTATYSSDSQPPAGPSDQWTYTDTTYRAAAFKGKRNCHSKASRCAVRGGKSRGNSAFCQSGDLSRTLTHTALRLCKHCNWQAKDSIRLEVVGLLSWPFPSWELEPWFANTWRKRKAKGKAATL